MTSPFSRSRSRRQTRRPAGCCGCWLRAGPCTASRATCVATVVVPTPPLAPVKATTRPLVALPPFSLARLPADVEIRRRIWRAQSPATTTRAWRSSNDSGYATMPRAPASIAAASAAAVRGEGDDERGAGRAAQREVADRLERGLGAELVVDEDDVGVEAQHGRHQVARGLDDEEGLHRLHLAERGAQVVGDGLLGGRDDDRGHPPPSGTGRPPRPPASNSEGSRWRAVGTSSGRPTRRTSSANAPA